MTTPSARNPYSLAGKSALVTGAAGGLGLVVARWFVEAGARVLLVDLKAEQLERAHASLSSGDAHVHACPADVTSEASVDAMLGTARATLGGLDILVNCAGIISSRSLLEADLDDWRRVHDVNVVGTMLATRGAARIMIEQGRGGRVINISSALSHIAIPNRVAYAATKGAVSSFTRACAVELGPHGITVNALAPTAVVTDINRELMRTQPQLYQPLIDGTPLQRLCTAEDVAAYAGFLASDAAAFVTGQTHLIDGGYTVSG